MANMHKKVQKMQKAVETFRKLIGTVIDLLAAYIEKNQSLQEDIVADISEKSHFLSETKIAEEDAKEVLDSLKGFTDKYNE